MAINPIHILHSTTPFSKIQKPKIQGSNTQVSNTHAAGQPIPGKLDTKQQSQIMPSYLSLSAKDKPLQLIYQAMITKLNDELAPYLGSNSIQKSVEEGVDVSPAATADRIVSLATGFYGAFKAQHQGEDDQQVLDNFMDTIGSGIERGFAEARDILDQLGSLQGDIKTNIERTFAFMKIGLNDFHQVQQDLLP